MRRDDFRLGSVQRPWFYATFVVLFATGVLWLVFHHYLRVRGEFGETASPWEPWWLKLHGAGAMVFLVILGSLLSVHIRRAWNAPRNRLTGGAFIAVNALLVVTGYALYYFGGERFRPVISALHWVTGLAFPAVLFWHIRAGRRLR